MIKSYQIFNSGLSKGVCLVLLASLIFSSASAAPLFESQKPLTVVLTAPFSTVFKERKKAVRPYHDGAISYKDNTEETVRLPVRIRTRGNFRRANCERPPLMLNFSSKETKGSLFKSQNKLKLVAPCQPGFKYQQYIGLEYLAYQIYAEVSDTHFKTRLLDINYLDSNKKNKPWTGTGFVIEEIGDLAKRTGHKQIRASKIKRPQMNLTKTALVEVFQLLIGNNDSSTIRVKEGVCCHNSRILVNKDGDDKYIPVPYDFDSSGIVDAPYAKASSKHPIESVRERFFTGWCKEDEHFQNAVDTFITKKQNILELAKSTPILTDFTRKSTIRYIERFYKMIENPKRVKRNILNRCRGQVVTG